VRPHVEYCTVAWSPHYIKDKELIEKIQHRFTKMIPDLRNKPYAERIEQLGLWTLEERRNRADVIHVYKMLNGLAMPKFESMFEISSHGKTRGHSVKLVKNRSRCELRRHFFSERVVNFWNKLDERTFRSASLNAF